MFSTILSLALGFGLLLYFLLSRTLQARSTRMAQARNQCEICCNHIEAHDINCPHFDLEEYQVRQRAKSCQAEAKKLQASLTSPRGNTAALKL